jgi:hypothetical protein
VGLLERLGTTALQNRSRKTSNNRLSVQYLALLAGVSQTIYLLMETRN